jgi:SAM-dependent methyltransferase
MPHSQRVNPDEETGLGPTDLAHLYRERFAEGDTAFKEEAWRILCGRMFQRYVQASDTVLDLGAGRCEFINAIRCRNKIAVDANPDVTKYARDARVLVSPSTDLHGIESGSIHVVFSSNLLEHLPTKATVLLTLVECRRVLLPGGTLILLMPNMRYLNGRYWDFFDHHTPLTHHSLSEALGLSGFRVDSVIPRFLPYSVAQTRLPKRPVFLRVYLRLRFLWPLMGRQMLVIATKPTEAAEEDRGLGRESGVGED